MLVVKSFKISEGEAISALLKESRLASSAHILVSDGQVAIPIEDGLPPTNKQIASQLAEVRNGYIFEKELAEHSLRVNNAKLKSVELFLSDLMNEPISSTVDKKVTFSEAAISKNKQEKGKRDIDETKNLILMNEAEINRLTVNITLLNVRIDELKK